jgi:hypothetical protein
MQETISKEEFEVLDPILVLQQDDKGRVIVALNVAAFEHPGAWGIVIADLVQHVANAYAQEGLAAAPVMSEIRRIVLAELDAPTDKAQSVRWEEA